MQNARAPRVAPAGTLSPGAETVRGAGEQGPFRVVFAAPRGDAASAGEISLILSRPLRRLDLAGEPPPPPIELQPPLAGRWQWVGTQALRFVPQGARLPAATRVAVTVPASLRALDGATLGEPYRFEFTTERPALVDIEPAEHSEGLVPSTIFRARFNQPVEPAVLQKAARLRAIRGSASPKTLAFRVSRPDPNEPKRVEIRPLAPLPIHSRIELQLSGALTGEEGPLEAGAPRTLAFRTYGPLTVEGPSCHRVKPDRGCLPGYPLTLDLSNPVKYGELKRAIRVTPEVPLRWESYESDDSYTSAVALVGPFQAGARYTVEVAPQLADRFGQKLGKPFSRSVAIDDYFPRVEIGVRGSALVPGGAGKIPLASVNVPSFELFAAELDAQTLPLALDAFEERDPLAVFERLRGSARRRIAPNAPANRLAKTSLDIADVLGGPGERGPFAVGVRYTGHPDDYGAPERLKVVKLTDLGLTAKLSRSGSMVWVTRLSSSEVVSGAEVSIVRKGVPAKTYRTDSQGMAWIPAPDFVPDFEGRDAALILARAGGDFTFEPVRAFLPPWRFGVQADLWGREGPYGMMFTDRGIYRPGDSVNLKGIVREPSAAGNALPGAAKVKLVLSAPDGEKLNELEVPLSRFGTFSTTLNIPGSASLGSFGVQALIGGERRLSESFEVAEYRPAEFEVGVSSEKPAYVRGDEARFTIDARYLFGAPMAGAAVRYSTMRSKSSFSVPNSEGFVTDASALTADHEERPLDARDLGMGEEKLGADGRLTFGRKLTLPGQSGTEVVTVDAEVTDAARQSIASSTTVVVHPAEFYAGIRVPADSFLKTKSRFSPGVVALSHRGERLAGKRMSVELVSRRWTLAHEDRGGQTHTVSKVVDRVVGRCELVTELEPVSCPLELGEAGYYVVHVRGVDSRKNTTSAALGVYALGDGAAAFSDNDRRELGLVTNKSQYQVGETAKILVKSPFVEAEALITVERAGVIRAERRRLRGPAPTIEVRVADELRPNAFVGVHLLKVSRDGKTSVPEYRAGYAELRVDPEARRLKVQVKPSRTDLRPGEELSVDLQVADRAGKAAQAELTLYAVDEGVLSLIGYQTPDPVPVFTGPRPLRVATVETRESLAKLAVDGFSILGQDKGGEGGGGGPMGARRDFRQTAFYDAKLVTDAQGRARARFKLPDSLTTFRVMAVAAGADDRYGFGQSRVTTSKRLMARPALPRFLRAGDRLQASVVVSAKDFGPERVTVSASAQGGLSFEGPTTLAIDLGRGESREVRFASRADRAGTARIRFEVRGGSERDAVEVERRIAAPASLETVALYGSARAPRAEKLGDLGDLRPDVGGLEVRLASSALVGLDASLSELVDYPYGCTEQLASRLLPLLPLADMARDFGLALPADARAKAERTVAEILARQQPDGGFGMWPESTSSQPWVAPYAIWALHEAARRGVAVPKLALSRSKDYLRRQLANTKYTETLSLASAAFVVDVLAEIGAPDPGYMGRLFEARQRLPAFSKAQLLHAFAVSKISPSSAQRLLSEIENQIRTSGDIAQIAENTGDEYAVLMDSPARSSALVLRALIAARPDHPLADELARGLLAVRRGGAWRTTQENAFALLALDAYRRAREAETPDFEARVWLGEQRLASARFEGRSVESHGVNVPSSRLAGQSGAVLAFERDGRGTLFYEARLRYATKKLPSVPLDQGFFVQKTLRAVKPAELESALRDAPSTGQTEFGAGELVLADLLIATPGARDFVVVDDPLPAGFEGVDARLATTASWARIPSDGGTVDPECPGCEEADRDALAHGRAVLSSPHRLEIRDDRALFFVDHMAAGLHHYRYLARATSAGVFVVPPTRAEEMYRPENFGRTAAALLVVK